MKVGTPIEFHGRRLSILIQITCALLFGACAVRPVSTPASAVQVHALRLGPGRDVLVELKSFAKQNHLRAASVASAVGSLTQSNLRYADQPSGTKRNGHFEITSLSGVIAESGAHIHMSIADEKGVTAGGHLLDENFVYTTLEIVLLEYSDLEFARELDKESGYKELVIKTRETTGSQVK